jgi:2,3-bisphosphoglycerate-independent phosphoglycerate mutase
VCTVFPRSRSVRGWRSRVLFIFLDGVGIGPRDPGVNPFLKANLPELTRRLGGDVPHLGQPEVEGDSARAFPLDPLLGVDGTPQSGTGQTALLTGENAPALYGRHFGPWVPVALRPLLLQKSLLARAMAMGVPCAFANAYPARFVEAASTRRPPAPPLAARGAGLLNRHEDALARGEALSSEIVNTAWRIRLGLTRLPEVTPREAGRNLARIVETARLTFFAHYSTDTAGHKKDMGEAVGALERVDSFLGGVLEAVPPGTLTVLASDHGNIEDITSGHTRNPTLALLAGPGSARLRKNLTRITDLPGMVLKHLQRR